MGQSDGPARIRVRLRMNRRRWLPFENRSLRDKGLNVSPEQLAQLKANIEGELELKCKAAQIKAFLFCIPVSTNNPALLFDWHPDAVAGFVDKSNQPEAGSPHPPPWITTKDGLITVQSLVNDIMNEAGKHARGRAGVLVFAPNTLKEMFALLKRIDALELDPWVQWSISGLTSDQCLATLSWVTDRFKPGIAIKTKKRPNGARIVFR